MYTNRKSVGFTIVELLIVVVVIAILAAITIVAYNGVTQRAKVSTLQSYLSSAGRLIETAKISSGTDQYPETLAAAKVQTASNATTGYTFSNTPPASFCLYAYDGSTRYIVSSDNLSPRVGTCSISNLVSNPSLSANQTGWSTMGYGSGGTASSARTAGIGPTGGYAVRSTWTTASTSGGHSSAMNTTQPIISGRTYTISAWVRSNQTTNNGLIRAEYGSGQTSYNTGATTTLPTNTWVRLSVTFTADQNASSLNIAARINDLVGTTNGLTFDVTNFMLTEGDTLHPYGDGNSAGWSWSGTTGASISSGPAL